MASGAQSTTPPTVVFAGKVYSKNPVVFGSSRYQVSDKVFGTSTVAVNPDPFNPELLIVKLAFDEP